MTTNITTMLLATEVVNVTTSPGCIHTTTLLSTWFFFGPLNKLRITVASVFFAISFAENTFVFWSLKAKKCENVIMLSLVVSNLVYTAFVMPTDATWNWTMEWLAGDFMCRVCQMLKQFGMFASSIHVVVLSLDRVLGVLCPMTKRKRQTSVMIICAWCGALLCSLPACFVYSTDTMQSCEGDLFYQCVDFKVIPPKRGLAFYYLFTMLISFVFPLIATVVAHALIACEISNMMDNATKLGGLASHRKEFQEAQKRTILLKSLIALTFLVSWGPYYAKGIHDWFIEATTAPPSATSVVMYQMMYLNPTLQPLVFGFFKKKVRQDFFAAISFIGKCRAQAMPRGCVM